MGDSDTNFLPGAGRGTAARGVAANGERGRLRALDGRRGR
jgi:hypothetical protein